MGEGEMELYMRKMRVSDNNMNNTKMNFSKNLYFIIKHYI